jgi:hypothetical protein
MGQVIGGSGGWNDVPEVNGKAPSDAAQARINGIPSVQWTVR